MTTFFRLVLLLCFGAGAACIGAGIENHRASEYAKAHKNDPLAVIGVGSCQHWLGALGITKDGVVHAFPDVSPEVAQALSKTLPDANSGLINIPCGSGDTTT